jgi:hypothetical protein
MWDSIDIKNFEKFKEIVSKGSRINGTEITELYNKIFNKKLAPTNCSSCISLRYKELRISYENFKKELEKQEEKLKALEVLDNLMTPTPDEFEPYIPTEDEVLMDEEEINNNPKKRGRPRKE